jgi:hypothetical protein
MVSAETSRTGPRQIWVQAHGRPVSDLSWERSEGHHRGTAERRKTKRSGRGDGESECSDSTGEAGEPTRGTPWREGEHRVTELLEGKVTGTPISDTVSTKLQRIAELAREAPERAFLSLAHYIDIEFLQEAFRRTRKDGATGVDGLTGRAYEERLEENLKSLLDRFKSGQYKAPPVRRTYDTHLRGQGAAKGGHHGAGSRLRAGLSVLLVWLPTWPLGAHGAGGSVAGTHGHGRRLGHRVGHHWILRPAFTLPAPKHSRPAGTRWSAASDDRQVACRRRDGGDPAQSPRMGCGVIPLPSPSSGWPRRSPTLPRGPPPTGTS